jgi:outer membrane protein assembly factor BamA
MAETQRRLYDLGVFARVDAAVQNPDGDEDRKYVLYQAEEAHRYSITGGVGAEIARIGGSTAQADLTDPSGATGFSPRVSLDISRINAFGIGDTITLRSRLSTLQKRAALDYLVPRLFGSHLRRFARCPYLRRKTRGGRGADYAPSHQANHSVLPLRVSQRDRQ